MEGNGTVRWRKSSYSGNNGGNCVQAGTVPGTVLVRDTKDINGPALSLSAHTWQAFTGRIKNNTT